VHAILVCENALQHPDATAWRMLSPLLVFSERLLLLMRSARERQVQHGCVFRLQEHRLHVSDSQQSVSCTQKRHVPKLVTSLVVGHDLHGSDEHDAEMVNPNNIFNLCAGGTAPLSPRKLPPAGRRTQLRRL